MTPTQATIFAQLQKDLLFQQFRPQASTSANRIRMGPVLDAFPNRQFPCGCIHEFCCTGPEDKGATAGFISGILSFLMDSDGICAWIGNGTGMFPPALSSFGIDPSRVIFITLSREKDILWAMEEALKCEGLSAVIAETAQLDFKTSRRLQLAVEKSRVTGFVIRPDLALQTTACVTRWHISPSRSFSQDGIPGIGFPRWEVKLQKVRNGNPGQWTMEWRNGQFTGIVEKETWTEAQKHAV